MHNLWQCICDGDKLSILLCTPQIMWLFKIVKQWTWRFDFTMFNYNLFIACLPFILKLHCPTYTTHYPITHPHGDRTLLLICTTFEIFTENMCVLNFTWPCIIFYTLIRTFPFFSHHNLSILNKISIHYITTYAPSPDFMFQSRLICKMPNIMYSLHVMLMYITLCTFNMLRRFS